MNRAAFFIVGAGGLGCPAALALARGGARRITMADADDVELSNLPRQLLHRTGTVGESKVASALRTLRAAFPDLDVEGVHERVDASNAVSLFRRHDVVIDATDGIGTKFLLSDVAVKTGKPLIHGGVLRMGGLAFTIEPGGPCLRCMFPEEPDADSAPTCAQAGVLGPVAGVVGALQATLALEAAISARRRSKGEDVDAAGSARVHHFDAARFHARQSVLSRDPACPVCSHASTRREHG